MYNSISSHCLRRRQQQQPRQNLSALNEETETGSLPTATSAAAFQSHVSPSHSHRACSGKFEHTHTHKHWKTNTKTIRQLLFKACHSFPLWFAQLLFYYPSKKRKTQQRSNWASEDATESADCGSVRQKTEEKEVTACESPFLFFKGEMRLSWQKKKLLPEQDGSSVALQGANWAKLNQIEHCTGLTRLCTEARTQSRRSVSECKSPSCVFSMNMNFYLFFFLLFYRPVTPWFMGGCTLTHTGTFCNPQMQTFCPLSPCCCC